MNLFHLVLVCLVQLLKFICLSNISRFEGLNSSYPLLSKRRLHHLGRTPVVSAGGNWETLDRQAKSSVVMSPVRDPGWESLPAIFCKSADEQANSVF